MPNPLQMMKQLHQVRKIQKELASRTFDAKTNDGTVAVVVRGDMTVKSITIDPKAMDPARPDRLANTIVSMVNSAFDSAKKGAAADMARLTQGMGGLSDLFKG
jgi:DNA-binding YbaB/EbfC family protein